jgi:putative nucleotidyltransferase with HDIG domain
MAAGYSSRMVELKPLLALAGSTAFERCIGMFRAAGVSEVIAVLGHRADELRSLAERCGARCVFNPHFDRGMYSSIVAGSRALPGWAKAAFMLPADIPLVRAATVRALAATFATHEAGIVYPVFAGHRGHPPLIVSNILAEAAQDGAPGPLSALLARHEDVTIDLPVADEAIHLDMNTPADYDALCSLAAHRDVPTAAECEAILAGQSVDLSVVRHSRKVAEVAHRVASALLRSGLELNLELVQAGALLHDLAKGQPDHATVGASILRSMDFPQVAEIVGAHTDLGFSSSGLDESAIVYLADKLVRGEDLVTIPQRFQSALVRFGNDPLARKAAQRRMETAKEVAFAVETRLGAPLSIVALEDCGSLAPPSGTPIAKEVAKA